MISIKEVREAQEILKKALESLRKETVQKVEEAQPLEGVKLIKSNMAIISASSLSKNGWCPSVYLPSCQIQAIEKATANISTFDSFVKKLETMVEKKSVKVGSETTYLNEKTLAALNAVLIEINS